MVREFSPAESLVAHILFAVDITILFGQMLDKLLVDDGESSFIVDIGLFDAYIEGGLVDRTTESKCNELIVDPYRAARQAQTIPPMECSCHRTQLDR